MPFPVGSLISGLGSLFGAGLGAISGSHNASKSLSAQRRENELNRQHNLKLAQLQNKWNMEMYDKNNEYNSPIEQRKRLQAAGLNPDLMYSGSGGLVAAQAPPMTAGEGSHSSVNPSIAPYDAAGNINNMFDNAVKMAQVGLIKAQTKKVDAEGDSAISDAKFRDSLNQSQLALNGANISYINGQLRLTDAEITKVTPYINNLNASTSSIEENLSLIRQQAASLGEDVVYKRIQNQFASKEMQARIDNLCSQTGFSKAQTVRALTLLSHEVLNLDADTSNKYAQSALAYANRDVSVAQGIKASYEADEFKFRWDAKTKYGIGRDAVRAAEQVSGFMEIIGSILDPFKGLLGGSVSKSM